MATTVAVRANGYLEAMVAAKSLAWEVKHGVVQLDSPGSAADAGFLPYPFFMA